MRGRRFVPLVLFVLTAWLVLACGKRGPTDLEGRPIDPLATTAPVSVLVFVGTRCPVSNRYAPAISRIAERFAARGAELYVVYPGDGESVAAVRAHVAEHKLPGRVVLDPGHALVERTGVSVTPEAVVFAKGELVYRGRVDDRQVDLGVARPEATTHDLESALEAVLEGRPAPVKTTIAIGCSIPRAR